MNRHILYMMCAAALAAACADSLPEPAPQQENTTAAVAPIPTAEAGQVLVKLAAGAKFTDPAIAQAMTTIGATSTEPLFVSDSRHKQREAESGINRWHIVHFDTTYAVSRVTLLFSDVSGVEAVQANTRRPINLASRGKVIAKVNDVKALATNTFFNDPALPYQWHYINTGDYTFNSDFARAIAGCDVGCDEAWPLCTGDSSIIVAVMDEGVMYSHPDLDDNMWVNADEDASDGDDHDGNGYVDDIHGWNFSEDDAYITWQEVSDVGHGTHVAGVIAAVNNNGKGVCGIAGGSGHKDGVKIMSLQIIDDGYSSLLSNECRAFKYAADNGAVIIQCSWGYNSWLANMILGFTPGPKDTDEWTSLYPLEREAIDYFTHYAGSPNGVIEGGLAIFASGNEYSAAPAFPAGYEGCIAVSAVSADFTPSSYTDYGSKVELCAPGGDLEQFCRPGTSTEEFLVGPDRMLLFDATQQAAILSTCVLNAEPAYAWYEGTSMACPHVSGVAALGLSYAKQLGRHFTADEYRKLLISTARDIDSYFTGEKTYYYNHTSHGAPANVMNLADYRGKMGRMVHAGALLKAVESGGSDMVMPNVKAEPNKPVTLTLTDFFRTATTFACDVRDTRIAKATVSGAQLTITPMAEGTTAATIKADGTTRSFVITVKKSNPHGGWLVRKELN